MSLTADMAKLANAIVEQATGKKTTESDVSLQDMIDALKVLIAYHSALKKSKKPAEDESDDDTLAAFSRSIEAAGEPANGRPSAIRSRHRRVS